MSGPRHSAKTRARVIEAFRATGLVSSACEAVGVPRKAHYDWLKEYPDYRAAYEEAREPVVDLILDEVVRRGIEGWDEPVFSAGKRAIDIGYDADGKAKPIPAVIRRKSDACLLALAAARVPGFNLRQENRRLVDEQGKDRDVNVTVEYVNKPLPDEASADPDTD